MTPLVLGITACVLCEGFFSGAEIAMVAADRTHLAVKSAEGNKSAGLALDLLSREHRLISTCLIGTNLAVITGTTLFAMLVTQLSGPTEAVLLYIPITVILSEALPKTIFQHHATVLAPHLAWWLRTAETAFTPLLALAGLWSNTLRRLIGSEGEGVSRDDIVQLFEATTQGIDPEESRMIRKVFELPEVPIEDCMTPLVDLIGLPIDATVGDAVELMVRHGYSRLPVYRDRVDNIVGTVQHTDLLFGTSDGTPVSDLMQPVPFVPESKRADDLLHEMRRERSHFAVVVDEYGGTVGIVTIEDLIEEFIGEIHDERDAEEPGVRKLSDRTWRVHARVEIDALSEVIGREVPEGDYETIAGLILAETGRIPRQGEVIELDGLTLRIEEATDRAIVGVRLTLR